MRYLMSVTLIALLGGCSADKSVVPTADGNVTVDHNDKTVTVKSTKDGKTETVQVNEADGEMKMTSKEGTLEISGTKVPEGFPLTIPAGAEVKSAMHNKQSDSGEETFVVQLSTTASVKETAAGLEKQLTDKGIKFERTEQSADGNSMVFLNGESETDQAGVQVTTDEGKTNVVITWTRKKA